MKSFILLWIIPIAFNQCFASISKRALRQIMSKEIILPNNKIVMISDLYGAKVTVENFNPGEKFLRFLHLNSYRRPMIDFTRFPDSKTAADLDVSFDYYEKPERAIETTNLILIKGDPKTGKTRLLRSIQSSLTNQLSPLLVIYVDLQQFIGVNKKRLTLNYILKQSIHRNFVDFIKNIGDINPSKIKVFFDGVDQVPKARKKLISIISGLHAKDIGIIMTSCTDIRPDLKLKNMEPATFDIPSTLNHENFRKMTVSYWSHQLSYQHVWIQFSRLIQYSETLQILLEETPMPRSAGIIQKLAEYLLRENPSTKFPTVREYMIRTEAYPVPKTIIKQSNEMYFPKMSFYDSLLQNPNAQLDVYGPQAWKMILSSTSTGIPSELTSSVTSSSTKLARNGQDTYKYLKFENNMAVDFVHEDYKRYFAAKYVLESLSTSTPLIELFKTLIHNSKHIFVLEFINSALHKLQYSDRIMNTLSNKISLSEYTDAMLDNLIEYRLDTLCSKIFQILGPERMKIYLDASKSLQSKNKYSFGMLSEVRDIDPRHYLPRKTPWSSYRGNRVEMILNLDLKQSQSVARRLGYIINSNVELIYAAKQNYQQLRDFVRSGNQRYRLDVLNRAMYESLRTLGPDSIAIMHMLHGLGAQPDRIDVNGRTLAHEAARWCSRQLLQTLHESFRVSLKDTPDAMGQTVLFDLLDAGMPFNTYTTEGAWEAMEYLVQHGDLSCNREVIAESHEKILRYAPKMSEIPIQYLNLLIYKHTTDIERLAVMEILRDYIPFKNVDLSEDVSGIRRKLIIKNCVKKIMTATVPAPLKYDTTTPDVVTVSEIVILHKDIIGYYNSEFYKRTLKYLLQREARVLNRIQIERVITNIAKTTIYMEDMRAIEDIIRTEVQLYFHEPLILDVRRIFLQRAQQEIPRSERGIALDSHVVETIYDWYPNVFYAQPGDEERLNEILATQDEGYESPGLEDAMACNF